MGKYLNFLSSSVELIFLNCYLLDYCEDENKIMDVEKSLEEKYYFKSFVKENCTSGKHYDKVGK